MKIILGILTLLTFTGCGEDDSWTYGQVTEREFQPAHVVHHPGYYTDGGETCIRYGSEYYQKICIDNPDVWHPPHDQYVPDRWRVRIAEDSDGRDETTELHWIWVHEETYDYCEIGRTYDHEATKCVTR